MVEATSFVLNYYSWLSAWEPFLALLGRGGHVDTLKSKHT